MQSILKRLCLLMPFASLLTGHVHAQIPAEALTTAPAPESQDAKAAVVRKTAPADAFVYIGWPQDGTVIRSTKFKVWFGARNVGIAPAGVNVASTGHHHLLIDTPLPADLDIPIPNDRNHLHFGLGQTETLLELPPGPHTLQLLLGDADHLAHDPPLYSRKIAIYVEPGSEPRKEPPP